MTIIMWFFLIVWAVFLLLFFIGSVIANVKAKQGIVGSVLSIFVLMIISIIYWGVLIFLDIWFNLLHWF